MKIFNSASKLVFVLMAIGALILTTIKVMDVKDFVVLTSMAFSFYFSKPSNPTPVV
jgi:hypothetical protein